jgi:hypothetical protein
MLQVKKKKFNFARNFCKCSVQTEFTFKWRALASSKKTISTVPSRHLQAVLVPVKVAANAYEDLLPIQARHSFSVIDKLNLIGLASIQKILALCSSESLARLKCGERV